MKEVYPFCQEFLNTKGWEPLPQSNGFKPQILELQYHDEFLSAPYSAPFWVKGALHK